MGFAANDKKMSRHPLSGKPAHLFLFSTLFCNVLFSCVFSRIGGHIDEGVLPSTTLLLYYLRSVQRGWL